MPAYKYTTKAGKQFWYVNFYYTDWTGARKHKCKRGFATKREATEWEASFLNKGASDPSIAFSSLAENYLEDMKARLKPTTFQTKESIVRKKFIPYFGNLKVSEIDARRIRIWQNNLIEYRDSSGNGYSQTYLKALHSQLSAIFNFAVRYYHLEKNPCANAGGIGKGKASEMTIWSREQFEHFIALEQKKAFHLAFNVLFYTGMREGELLALTPADILTDTPTISITKNYAVIDGVEMFLTPKTPASIRQIAIHQKLHQELLDWITLLKMEPDERIFYFKKSGLLYELRKISKIAGLPKIRIHDLRHSHASMLIHMGVPVTEISKRLGHDSPATTLRIYSHLYPGKERSIAEQIDSLF